MRNMLFVLVFALVAIPTFAMAGDKIHHGHGMKSGWDSQTGDGPQGSEWVTAPPAIREFHDGRYYNRGHYDYQNYYPYQPYYTPTYSRRTELTIGYNNGNWSTTYRNAPSYSYYPAQAYYPPNYGYQPYPAYQYPVIQPTYQQQDNYQDYQRYPSAPIYSAPANPDLGYYAQPPQQQQQPKVVNIYNYYNGEFANTDQQAAPVAQQPELQARPAAPTIETPEPPRAFGTRFYKETVLQTETGLTFFTLDGNQLLVGPENGPPATVANTVDPALGVLAIYQEGVGISLVYKSGGQLVAASQFGSKWVVEPCPQAIDFSEEVSLGVLGGSAWIVAMGQDGSRYVLSYSGGSWQEIGSGTFPAS